MNSGSPSPAIDGLLSGLGAGLRLLDFFFYFLLLGARVFFFVRHVGSLFNVARVEDGHSVTALVLRPAAQRRWNVESAATGAALAGGGRRSCRAHSPPLRPPLYLAPVIFEPTIASQLRFLKGTNCPARPAYPLAGATAQGRGSRPASLADHNRLSDQRAAYEG
ncbi:unnamed protein product [Chrysodeixis includens]|uniref:Uncharacterized protein n=1 Tax=Chrysodeixis includens TaxID=689277 RepID=A0A9N8Q0Q7_CHRIL|nr:unnamed protein product [Chrysodeixis includens]